MGLDWQGFRDRGAIGRRFAEDGFLGEQDGQLIVTADGHAAGFVAWRAFSYGRPEHACWNIGIILLPEWRGRGVGSTAQRQLADYLVTFHPIVRVGAGAPAGDVGGPRAPSRGGFTRGRTLPRARVMHGARG